MIILKYDLTETEVRYEHTYNLQKKTNEYIAFQEICFFSKNEDTKRYPK